MPELGLYGVKGRCQGHRAGTAAESPAGECAAADDNSEAAGRGRLLLLPLSRVEACGIAHKEHRASCSDVTGLDCPFTKIRCKSTTGCNTGLGSNVTECSGGREQSLHQHVVHDLDRVQQVQHHACKHEDRVLMR